MVSLWINPWINKSYRYLQSSQHLLQITSEAWKEGISIPSPLPERQWPNTQTLINETRSLSPKCNEHDKSQTAFEPSRRSPQRTTSLCLAAMSLAAVLPTGVSSIGTRNM